ncbi:MAG: SAM-dependent chlorinase/fluorinase [Rhodocyclaceae bacterium]
MIVLYTDFGAFDPYAGQLKAALAQGVPAGTRLIDLLHEAPRFDIPAGAHLLDALQGQFPSGTIFVCAVDPGVGGERAAALVRADDKWFVGPDNGLLSVAAARARAAESWHVAWRPERLRPSFHARDVFAPVAAALARGEFPDERLRPVRALDVELPATDLARIIYIDHYGNAMTGLRAGCLAHDRCLEVSGRSVRYARIFGEAAADEPFWYENSIDLIELAIDRASAAARLRLAIGDPVGGLALPGAQATGPACAAAKTAGQAAGQAASTPMPKPGSASVQ